MPQSRGPDRWALASEWDHTESGAEARQMPPSLVTVPHQAVGVVVGRIVLTQQVLAVIVAIGGAHDRVNVVARGFVIIVDDARLMVEFDEDHRAQDTIVEGVCVIKGADPRKMRLAQMALDLRIADLGMAVT